MSFKTYLPQLLKLLRLSCQYIKRYESQIRSHLTTEPQNTALTTVLTACEAMEDILVAIIPPKS